MDITLKLASTHAEKEAVKNFFVAFFYDLSQYDDNIVINDYGLPTWAPSGLPGPTTHDECASFNWWVRDKSMLYLILVDGKPAGYASILGDKAYLNPSEVDYELLDFYITPKYRRMGIGRIAARLAFDLYHGTWQVYQLERNTPARVFWQEIIREYTGGNYENLDGGTQQRFRN